MYTGTQEFFEFVATIDTLLLLLLMGICMSSITSVLILAILIAIVLF